MAVSFLQRVGNALGVLLPNARALKFGPGITLTHRPDSTLAGAEGGDGQVTGYVELTLDTETVSNFGTKGDGTTNDTAAIEAAAAALPSTGGTLIFPDGTYLVRELAFTKPIRMMFGRGGLTAATGSAFLLSTTDNLVIFGQSVYETRFTSATGGAGIKFLTRTAANQEARAVFYTEHVGFYAGTTALDAHASDILFNEGDWRAHNCTFVGTTDYAIKLGHSVNYSEIDYCKFYACYGSAEIKDNTETKLHHNLHKTAGTGGHALKLIGSHRIEVRSELFFGAQPNLNADLRIESVTFGDGIVYVDNCTFTGENYLYQKKNKCAIEFWNPDTDAGANPAWGCVITGNKFLAPSVLPLASWSRTSNVVTIVITPYYPADGHGLAVGDKFVLALNGSTSGLQTATAVSQSGPCSITFANSGVDVASTPVTGRIFTAEACAIRFLSPGWNVRIDNNEFGDYWFAVDDTAITTADARGNAGGCSWGEGNKSISAIGFPLREFKSGGNNGFSYVEPNVGSSMGPVRSYEIVPEPKALENFLGYSEDFSHWTGPDCTLTTGQADPWGGTRATKVARSGGANLYTGYKLGTHGVDTLSINSGIYLTYDRSHNIGARLYASVYAKAGTSQYATIALMDTSTGCLYEQRTIALTTEWKRYVVPYNDNATGGAGVRVILSPGGYDATVQDCIFVGAQVQNHNGPYVPSAGSFPVDTTVGHRFERDVAITGMRTAQKGRIAPTVDTVDTTGLGSGGTVTVVSGGNDVSGQLLITSGSGPQWYTSFKLHFGTTLSHVPAVQLTLQNGSATFANMANAKIIDATTGYVYIEVFNYTTAGVVTNWPSGTFKLNYSVTIPTLDGV
jgi:hypothetical protein